MNAAALAFGGVIALLAACALLRRRTTDALGMLHFAGALIATSVPLHLAVIAVLGAGLLFAGGAGSEPVGQAGLVLALAAAAGLVMVFRRAGVASAALGLSLRDGLGPAFDVPARVPPPPATRSPAWLRPLHHVRPGVEVLRNLSYGDAGERNLLDLFRPAARPAQALPVLIQIHGSGWTMGRKDEQGLPLLYHLAARGWIGVAINYRLSPSARFPDHLVDVKKAIAWVRAHIAEYGGDPDFIAVTGGSAGGHLASLAGLLPNRPELQPGFEAADTRVSAVVPVYARFDLLNRAGHDRGDLSLRVLRRTVMPPQADAALWDLASPLMQVHRDAPPFFVIHPTHDVLIPIEEARDFVDRLRAVSTAPVIFAEVHGAQHAYDILHSPWTGATVAAIHHFLEAQYAARYARGGSSGPRADASAA